MFLLDKKKTDQGQTSLDRLIIDCVWAGELNQFICTFCRRIEVVYNKIKNKRIKQAEDYNYFSLIFRKLSSVIRSPYQKSGQML